MIGFVLLALLLVLTQCGRLLVTVCDDLPDASAAAALTERTER